MLFRSMHPSEFWCEIFEGEHLSVDFHHQQQDLVILGTKNEQDPIYKWKKWEKVNRKVDFPEILYKLKGNYEWINCEFIQGHLIEVQFRRNPNFRYNNSVAIPIWSDEATENDGKYRYIDDKSYHRQGFLID